MKPSKKISLCGVLAALAISLMALGGLFPMATYCCPVLAMAMLALVVEVCGHRLAWAWFFAVAILSCLLCPNVECAALFLFLGYYPILKRSLDGIRPAFLRVLAKTALFNVAIALMYLVLIFLMGVEGLAEEMGRMALILIIAAVVLGNATFWLTDLLLARLTRLLRRKGLGEQRFPERSSLL